MHLCYLLDVRAPTGIPNHTLQLARGMHRRGHRVTLLLSNDDTAMLQPVLDSGRYAGIAIEPAGVHGFQPAGKLLRRSLALTRRLRELRPDLLHVQRGSPYTLKWPLLAVRLRGGCPIVATDHDQSYEAGWKRRLFRNFDRCIARFIAVSEFSEQMQAGRYGRGARRIVRILHGIDLQRFRPAAGDERARTRRALGLPEDAPVVGFLGRLSPEKGVRVLLEAAAGFLPRAPGAVLAIAGSGPEEAAMRARAAELGLGGRVRFLGFVPDAAEFVRALDVFFMPSEYEAFGLVAAEAMASRVAVIASNACSLTEVVGHDGAGVLRPADDAAGFADEIAALLADPARRAEVAARGHARARAAYDEERMLDATESLYTELARPSPDGTRRPPTPANPSR